MYNITISEEIKNACPIFKGVAVYAKVTNTAFCEGLANMKSIKMILNNFKTGGFNHAYF